MLQQLYMATKGMASKYTLHRSNHKKESYAYEQWISGKHHAKLTSFITVSFRLSSFSASVKQSLFIKYQQQIDIKMHQTHVQSLFMSIVGDDSSGDRRGRLLRRSSGPPPAIVEDSSPLMSKLYQSYRGYI